MSWNNNNNNKYCKFPSNSSPSDSSSPNTDPSNITQQIQLLNIEAAPFHPNQPNINNHPHPYNAYYYNNALNHYNKPYWTNDFNNAENILPAKPNITDDSDVAQHMQIIDTNSDFFQFQQSNLHQFTCEYPNQYHNSDNSNNMWPNLDDSSISAKNDYSANNSQLPNFLNEHNFQLEETKQGIINKLNLDSIETDAPESSEKLDNYGLTMNDFSNLKKDNSSNMKITKEHIYDENYDKNISQTFKGKIFNHTMKSMVPVKKVHVSKKLFYKDEKAETEHKASLNVKGKNKINDNHKNSNYKLTFKDQHSAKENMNIVFIGHVDAGKSTIGGHIMYLTGMVDKRTLDKYEKEAREINRESWALSWALDINDEERDKGKTVEVGRASFETEKKHFTIFDAPGHSGFVPNMITGTTQADVSILVISARKDEFETGFERKGQTREHAILAKTAGIKHIVVVINKMDDPTVRWSEERFNEIQTKLTPFLKKVGFSPKSDIMYIPVSGLAGSNLIHNDEKCIFYKGPGLLDYLDVLPPVARLFQGPFRLPVLDKYKDMGTYVFGKIESGSVTTGQHLVVMPNKTHIEVMQILIDDEFPKNIGECGDNIKLKIKGIEEEDLLPGFVLCESNSLCMTTTLFDVQIVILEYKSIICAGYSAVMHVHTCVEEVQILQLLSVIDKKSGKKIRSKPRFVRPDEIVICRLQSSGPICIETFANFPQMGRFTLRDEGKTIAIGKILEIQESGLMDK